MVGWQYKISIKTVHALFDDDEVTINTVGQAMAKRLRASKSKFKHIWDKNMLEELADEFEGVETVYHYDCILANLYDWGDADHLCWIDSWG